MSSPQIRPLLNQDLAAVIELEKTAHLHPWPYKSHLDSIESGYPSLVFEIDSKLIGFIVFNYYYDECHLLDISVDINYQRQGVAQQLITAMLESAQLQGILKFILEVRASNINAQSLYQKVGFNQIGVRKNYYKTKINYENNPLYTYEDAIVMEKNMA